MVTGFHRSFSLPGSPRILKTTRPASSSEKSYHVRSISLPGRSHPLVSHLEDGIRSLHSWLQLQQHSSSQPESEASWICDGLARLELLHAFLADLINLPQNQDSLRRCGSGSEWTDRILDDFLGFADVHGSFRSEMLVVNELQSDAQVAVRRNDALQLASCVKSMKKTEKQIVKLASSINREALKSSPPLSMRFNKGIEEVELAGIVREVINVTVSASATLFLGMAAAQSSISTAAASLSTAKINSWTPLKRLSPSRTNLKNIRGEEERDCRRNVMQRLEEFEECVGSVEKKSERLFRCLVNTRVSLLNIVKQPLGNLKWLHKKNSQNLFLCEYVQV